MKLPTDVISPLCDLYTTGSVAWKPWKLMGQTHLLKFTWIVPKWWRGICCWCHVISLLVNSAKCAHFAKMSQTSLNCSFPPHYIFSMSLSIRSTFKGVSLLPPIYIFSFLFLSYLSAYIECWEYRRPIFMAWKFFNYSKIIGEIDTKIGLICKKNENGLISYHFLNIKNR